ncbi:hypothetical protein H5410_010538 [Solanum commersonii]|uniref:Uncharacterized protein n=1 Tax=Solanum commersonii TaxID=4109 RepID=A0A9J6AKZ4_SOLCO|nr:hypothetical protein H5410_010538 [Solanum commersonii]
MFSIRLCSFEIKLVSSLGRFGHGLGLLEKEMVWECGLWLRLRLRLKSDQDQMWPPSKHSLQEVKLSYFLEPKTK